MQYACQMTCSVLAYTGHIYKKIFPCGYCTSCFLKFWYLSAEQKYKDDTAFFTSNTYTEFTWMANISEDSPDLWKPPVLSVAASLYTQKELLLTMFFGLFWCVTSPYISNHLLFKHAQLQEEDWTDIYVHRTGLLLWDPICTSKLIRLRNSRCDSQWTQTLIYSRPRL